MPIVMLISEVGPWRSLQNRPVIETLVPLRQLSSNSTLRFFGLSCELALKT